jgi:DNA-binding NarL/FixJ family response regulator
VLLVENNPVVAGMIQRFLEKSNYLTAGPAVTGEAAVEMAGTLKPDLVRLDLEPVPYSDRVSYRQPGRRNHRPRCLDRGLWLFASAGTGEETDQHAPDRAQ